MYYVLGMNNHNKYVNLIDMQTMLRVEVTQKEFIDKFREGLIVPNNSATGIVVKKSVGLLATGIRKKRVTILDIPTDLEVGIVTETGRSSSDIFIAQRYVQYNLDLTNKSWRRNNFNHVCGGITILGNGYETYIYRNNRIYIIEGMIGILGIFWDGDVLSLWNRADYGEINEIRIYEKRNIKYRVGIGINVRIRDGSVADMKRMTLMRML